MAFTHTLSDHGDTFSLVPLHAQDSILQTAIRPAERSVLKIGRDLYNVTRQIGQCKTSSENLLGTCRVPAGYRPKRPMPARLLNPAGASRGYIPDGHRRNWDLSFTGYGLKFSRVRQEFPGTDRIFERLDIPLVVRLEPAFGHQAHAIVTLLERNVLYSFAALVIGQTSMDYEFMAKLDNLTSGVHWQASKKISLARDDENLSRHLMNLKQSNCRAFVLHGSPNDVRRVFRDAKTLGLTGSNHAWILTQAAVTTSQHVLEDYPVGAVAVRYSDDTLTDKIYDGTFLLMDSFNKVNRDYNGNGALQRRKSCHNASDSYKFGSEDFYK
ncbi:hypothetical protein Bbelb_360240 [Branchiostoma belcheri]|nr:hypothetical protein Bbelb_360240 [Branchiostoma belcheri]